MSMHQQQYGTQGGATGYGTGGQDVGGQQFGGQPLGGQGAAAGAGTFESSLSGSMRLALHDFVESLTACDWCADRCIDHGPEMAECIRLCRDVSDLAATNVQLMARDSIFGPEAARLFADAAEECARECARHPEPHCQECASVLSRAVDSTWQMLDSFEGGGPGRRGGMAPSRQGPTGGAAQGGMGQTARY